MAKRTKMGRPKKHPAELRKIVMQIRLSENEYQQLAEAVPTDLSTWAREVLLRAAARKKA